ncbi:MAG: RdgB/HAM1 family non-canonical purine NTP pyrophosphatase [Saprospiraceae bacterium]|jgi:XTP/dITP diphosphohydrolase
MKKKLVFATGNRHKVAEVREIVGDRYEILSLADIGCTEEIPETAPDLEGNALLKARFVQEHFGLDCFAEDTGLEVAALQGAPGVFSARYAGPGRSARENTALLLRNLEGSPVREAQFRTVIALLLKGETRLFEGVVKGEIALSPSGEGGFGYDPVFVPSGFPCTFAEMGPEAKNTISHRGIAVSQLLKYLEEA